ncbi:MAG: helix-turn-helix domain-containing protein [Anaerolineae bacterium]|nr:helix-turn-helix domain-containing protein [Anaerolineae bacterium]
MYKPIPTIKETADELKRLQKQERHPLKQKRLHALYLLASGQATERQHVARLLGVSRNSVGHWLDSYAEGGLSALLTVKPLPGRVPTLNAAQVNQLREALARPEGFGSYGEVQHWIASELGVTKKYTAVYHLVHDKLGARPKVARPSHPKKTRWP